MYRSVGSPEGLFEASGPARAAQRAANLALNTTRGAALAIPAASSATPMAPRISTAVAALAAGCTALSATTRPLRIGTRGSPLALAQAYMTRQLLMDNFEELSSEGAIQLVRSCFLFL